MATPNVGILTNAGKNLIDRVNAGQTKIAFSKIVFSSMNNNQLTDDQIKALTTVTPQEVVINNLEVTLDNNTGETRIRATGNNKALNDGVYVKTYAVYAKDGSSNEILYGITVSPNPNYLPEYDGVTPQAVTYSYKVNISNTSNITFSNSNDVYVSDTDLSEALQPYAKTVYVNQQLDKVVHNSGTEEIAGQKTFDIAPIDKTTGNPYITKDGAPSLPPDIARTGQSQTFTAAQTFSSAPAVQDTSSPKGDNQVALMGDLKSVENSAWHIIPEDTNNLIQDIGWIKIDPINKFIYLLFNFAVISRVPQIGETIINLSNYVDYLSDARGYVMLSSNERFHYDEIWGLSHSYRSMSSILASGSNLIVKSGFIFNDPADGGNYLNLTTFNDKVDQTSWANKTLRVKYNNWIGS